jgi:hypothetical protein
VSDLAALDAITEAVESGAGLPEVVRAAAKALDASLAVTDAWGATLAVAARSPAEERSLLSEGDGVSSSPLRVADTVVGTLHMRAKAEPSDSMRRLLLTIIASEVERVRAPERVSESASADFLRAILSRELSERDEVLERAKAFSLVIEDGASPRRWATAGGRARGGEPLDRRAVRARGRAWSGGPGAGPGR